MTGSLVAAAAGTASSAQAGPGPSSRLEVIQAFAEQSRERSHAATPRRDAATTGTAGAAAQAPQKEPGALDRQETPSEDGSARSASSADCAGLDAQVSQTLDHSHVSWQGVPDATSYVVQRQRYGGTTKTIATLGPDARHYEDTTHNPMGSVAYTVRVTVAGATTSCRSPEEDGWWSMSSEDGVGYPDVFFAGEEAVWEQDTYGPAFEGFAAQASRPAFSPNGRLVAAVEPDGDSTKITVRTASSGALQWSVASPAGVMLDEPAFSPDGQRIAVESLDAEATPQGLYTIAVNGTHTLTPVPNTAGLATPDWVDTPGAARSTTIVAATIADGGLLTLVNSTTGARTDIAGTADGLDPMGEPNGSILFVTYDGTDSRVQRRSPTGTITNLAGVLPDMVARWPVADPNGDVYTYVEEPDTQNPGQFVWSVYRIDSSGVGTPTILGMPYDLSDAGFYGFDLRTAVSPGTSNLGGSANPDILARSTTGDLYAYPLSATNTFFDARQKVGTGWNVMKQFVAAGDLNGDRRGDVLAVDTSGVLWFYPGKGGFRFNARSKAGSGWSSLAIISTGDWNGDTRADLVARDSGGRLWLYPGNGSGGLSARTQIGSGWGIFSAILGTGDWDYDNRPDLLARDRATGVMYVYPGNGTGGFLPRRVLGKGWNARTAFATPETWRGLTALFARTTDGVLLDYDSVGDGVTSGSAVYQAGKGWNPYTITG